MSKEGVHPSSIHFLSFRWMSVRSGDSKSNFGVEVARWCIEEVHGVVQVFQSLIQEFRIIPKFEARIGCQVFIGGVKMESISRVFTSCLSVDVELEAAVPDPILVSRWLVVALWRFVVWSKCSKIGLEE